MAELPRVHIIIPTHTTRHLAACLSGLARQTVMPASVAVSCDTDDPAIGELLDRTERPPPPCRVIQVSRKHQGWPHPAQVRNNAVRGLEKVGALADGDVLLGIDGDIVLCPEAVARHATYSAKGAELVIGFRLCLSEEATARYAGVYDEGLASREEVDSLAARDRRYRRNLSIRRVPVIGPSLIKPHKPKLISAHYSVSVKRFRQVNGFDEEYTHYGYEDDDLGKRLHAVKARCEIGVAAIPALHLWHPSRAPSSPMEAPGYKRFCMDLPMRAVHGLVNEKPQPPVSVREVRG